MEKIRFARKLTGQVIHADNANIDDTYLCPKCGEGLQFRPERKSGKGLTKPCFVHVASASDCTNQSVILTIFIEWLHREISERIVSGMAFPIEWTCRKCGEQHQGNLVKMANSFALPQAEKVMQGMIFLKDETDKTYAAVNVILQGEKGPKSVNYCLIHKLNLVRYIVGGEGDISRFWDKIQSPDLVTICSNPKCKCCEGPTVSQRLSIIDGSCHQCHGAMPIAYITRNGNFVYPDSFTEEDIALANSKGANIQFQYSKSMEASYWANSCAACGAFAGKTFLFSEYVSYAERNEMPKTDSQGGFYCERCKKST